MSNTKRVVATISVYTYGELDQHCFDEAKQMCKMLNEEYDCHATVDELVEVPKGTIGESRKIDKSKLNQY